MILSIIKIFTIINMSTLHHELIEKYHNYILSFRLVSLSKNHYLFRILTGDRSIMSGTAIPLGTYDHKRNVIIWSDISHVLDKNVVKEVRDIRKNISKTIDSASASASASLSHDFVVMTQVEMNDMLMKISKILNNEILLDQAENNTHIYVVNKILTDDR